MERQNEMVSTLFVRISVFQGRELASYGFRNPPSAELSHSVCVIIVLFG